MIGIVFLSFIRLNIRLKKGIFNPPWGPQATPQNMAKFLWENTHFVRIERFTSAPADAVSTSFRRRFDVVSTPLRRRFEVASSALRRPLVNPIVKTMGWRYALRRPLVAV